MRTPPGRFKTKFKPPGSGCRCQRPSTWLLITLGVARIGFRRNHFSCQSVPACYTAGCLSRTSRTYRALARILPRRPYTCTTTCHSCSSRREPCTTISPRSHLCGSHGDTTRCCEHFIGPFPDMIKSWKEDFMHAMKSSWEQFVGDAPPQPTVGPTVPFANMGPDVLQQLSPSDDREALQAQRKAGSKRADTGIRQSSRSSERSSADRHRDRVRHHPVSPYSSDPTRRLSPPAKRSRLGSHHAVCGSSSSEGREWSLRLAFLGDHAHLCHVAVVLHSHLHLITAGPRIVRLPLVGLYRLAGLGGLLDNHPCCEDGDHLHLIGGHEDHPWAANCPLGYGPGPPIVIPLYRPPGHLHLKDLGPAICPRAISAPGHPARIIFLDRMQLTNTYAFVSKMETNIHVILQYQNNQPPWMTLSCQLRRCKSCSQTFWTLLHFLTTLIHCRIVRRAISWRNSLKANPENFQSMLISSHGCDVDGLMINVENTITSSSEAMKVLGVKIDDKLNFTEHILDVCTKARRQLYTLQRLKQVLDYKSHTAIYKSFIMSSFNYCPIVWMFTCKRSLDRIEIIQKRALRFVLDDSESSYHDLLIKCEVSGMRIMTLRL